MSSPKFRFALLVGALVLAWWIYAMVSTYLIGERGLNFGRYVNGVLLIGTATAGGFLLVWIATLLMARTQRLYLRRTYTGNDDSGITLQLEGESAPLNVGRFLPDIVAPPNWPNLSPLESELIGFLNGYRHWPADLERAERSLFEEAMTQWDAVSTLPGNTPLHRAAALAQVLGKVYAYREVRTPAKWWQIGKRDAVHFQRRCHDQGGLAAMVLASLPSFAQLSDDPAQNKVRQRALQAALKYQHRPHEMPTNAEPLARELIEMLRRGQEQVAALHKSKHFKRPDAALLQGLHQTIRAALPRVFERLRFSSRPGADSEAVLLADGRILVRVGVLMGLLAEDFSTTQREALHLWAPGGGPAHPAWGVLREILEGDGVLSSTWDGNHHAEGWFSFQLGPVTLARMAVMTPPAPITEQLMTDHGDKLYRGLVLAQGNPAQTKERLTVQANKLTEQLGKIS